MDYLNEIYINGNKKERAYRYMFSQEDNFVELRWKTNINNCNNMFSGCTNIYEINLQSFISSQVNFPCAIFSWTVFNLKGLIS